MPTFDDYGVTSSEGTYVTYDTPTKQEEIKSQNNNALLSPKTTISAAHKDHGVSKFALDIEYQ